MRALIKIGGALLDDPATRSDIARQIAALLKSGISITVVHGGGKQMTRFLTERGVENRFVNGLRVTTPEVVDAVLKVFAGTVNTELVGALAAHGVKAVGLTGIDAGLALAEQIDPELGFVGRVVESDPAVLAALTGAHLTPVVACVAGGRLGEVFNVNGDSMAVAVAAAWKADRLVFLTDVPGVLDADKNLLPLLTIADCNNLIASKVATGGMQAKLTAATDAVANGVGEVRIVRGMEPDVLTHLFAGATFGTRIVAVAVQEMLNQ